MKGTRHTSHWGRRTKRGPVGWEPSPGQAKWGMWFCRSTRYLQRGRRSDVYRRRLGWVVRNLEGQAETSLNKWRDHKDMLCDMINTQAVTIQVSHKDSDRLGNPHEVNVGQRHFFFSLPLLFGGEYGWDQPAFTMYRMAFREVETCQMRTQFYQEISVHFTVLTPPLNDRESLFFYLQIKPWHGDTKVKKNKQKKHSRLISLIARETGFTVKATRERKPGLSKLYFQVSPEFILQSTKMFLPGYLHTA